MELWGFRIIVHHFKNAFCHKFVKILLLSWSSNGGMNPENSFSDFSLPFMEKQSFFFPEHFVTNFCYCTLLHNYSCQGYPTATLQASYFSRTYLEWVPACTWALWRWSENKLWESFSHSILWVLGIKLMSSVLVASDFTCGAISSHPDDNDYVILSPFAEHEAQDT